MPRFAFAIMLLVSCSLMSGCGGGEKQMRRDLKQTGLAWHDYYDVHKVGPKNWDELIAGARDPSAPASIKRVRDAGYEMNWVSTLDGVTDQWKVVLAKPKGEGLTLMLDSSVVK